MSHYDKARFLFGFPHRHGIFFVIFALLWPLITWATIWVIPFLIRYVLFQIIVCLSFGGLVSIFASNYCSVARLAFLPESSEKTSSGLSKRAAFAFCIATVIVSVLSVVLFFLSIFIPGKSFSVFLTAAIVGYVAVAMVFLYSGDELFALYRPGYKRDDRNDTYLAWSAFLFSVDLILIAGFFTWVVYHLLKA